MMLIFVSQFVIRKKKKKKKSCAEIGTTNKKNVTKNELDFSEKNLARGLICKLNSVDIVFEYPLQVCFVQ